LWSLTELVEKPSIDKTPSDLALAGRYILTPEIFKAIEDTPKDKNNEIQLTDALQLMLQREDIFAHAIEGKRYDIGNKMDYLKTIVEISLKKDDISEDFFTFLKKIVSEKK
jgi:UTP--glucose-1-phosphate uridylyltransferase